MKTKRNRNPMLSMRCYEYGCDPAEDINIDEDGQVTSASLTYEPHGTSIEVLVGLDTPPAEAAKFLRNMAHWVHQLLDPVSLKKQKKSLEDDERRKRDRRNREILQEETTQ